LVNKNIKKNLKLKLKTLKITKVVTIALFPTVVTEKEASAGRKGLHLTVETGRGGKISESCPKQLAWTNKERIKEPSEDWPFKLLSEGPATPSSNRTLFIFI